jgi:hypothetical protein
MSTNKLDNVEFQIFNEADLSFKQHNEIHLALNLAYEPRTQSFLKKTYGHCEPVKRILCYEDGQLVGHTAIFVIEAFLPKLTTVGGVGMTLSLKKGCGLGHELRRRAAIEATNLGLPFAVGRVKNTQRVKDTLTEIVVTFLDLPMIGQSTQSHDWETLAIYDCGQTIKSELDYITSQGKFLIKSEVF